MPVGMVSNHVKLKSAIPPHHRDWVTCARWLSISMLSPSSSNLGACHVINLTYSFCNEKLKKLLLKINVQKLNTNSSEPPNIGCRYINYLHTINQTGFGRNQRKSVYITYRSPSSSLHHWTCRCQISAWWGLAWSRRACTADGSSRPWRRQVLSVSTWVIAIAMCTFSISLSQRHVEHGN